MTSTTVDVQSRLRGYDRQAREAAQWRTGVSIPEGARRRSTADRRRVRVELEEDGTIIARLVSGKLARVAEDHLQALSPDDRARLLELPERMRQNEHALVQSAGFRSAAE